jgi:hypothetical protein
MSPETTTFFHDQWQDSIEGSLKILGKVPPELLCNGPTYEQTSKKGEKINLTTQYYYFKGAAFEPCPPPGDGIRCYLMAKDEDGAIVGSRISSIFRTKDSLSVRSRITVKERGQGMASLIEDAFVGSLQQLANSENRKVVWEVSNENVEHLQQHREQNDLDPAIMAQLEEEQERWQYLYGEGGKYQIHNGKRIFVPSMIK